MKAAVVFAALAVTVSAYRCKFDRIKDQFPQLCSDSGKVGDQTESDKCSSKHSNSCYKVHHGTPGDANCKLYITAGKGCDADDEVYAVVPCTPGMSHYEPREHSYVVRCT
ncbi:hypothetical protein PWT90_01001 [Aphanocladium album]|nr:hypothetical protein PWT90_01001 [Aphanocladium album]